MSVKSKTKKVCRVIKTWINKVSSDIESNNFSPFYKDPLKEIGGFEKPVITVESNKKSSGIGLTAADPPLS